MVGPTNDTTLITIQHPLAPPMEISLRHLVVLPTLQHQSLHG